MCTGTIMESFVNSSNDINITELLDDIFSDIPLVATFLKLLLLSVTTIMP